MSRYLVEVKETITHIVTVTAEDEHQVHVKALEFMCVEAEQLAPVYVCGAVRPLQEHSGIDGGNGTAN